MTRAAHEEPERRREPITGFPQARRTPGALWRKVKERRLFQIVASYAAAGWIALEVIGSVVERGLLPELAYQVGLIWFLGGLPAAAVIGWFHGERGHQHAPRAEVVFLTLLAFSAFGLSAFTVNEHHAAGLALSAAEKGGLELNRIGVAYFRDAGTGELQYLGDALTEELIDGLSRVRALDVASRNAVAPLRELEADSVARALGVGTLVWGTVERRGERVRVELRLIDGASGAEFRRAAFEHPLEDVGAVVAELGDQAARALREWLGMEVRLQESRRATDNSAAWSHYQRAERRRKDAAALAQSNDLQAAGAAFTEADELAARAAALEPGWADPLVLRANLAYQRALLDRTPQSPWIDEGLRRADEAVAAAPNSARALQARGTLRYWRFHMPLGQSEAERQELLASARADLEEAVRLDPSLASAHATLSNLYYEVPDVAAALLAGRRAYEEDAYLDNAALVISRLFFGSLDLEQFGEATRWCREGAERFPADSRFAFCPILLMSTPAQPPDVDRAWALVEAVDSLAAPSRRSFERARATVHTASVIARAGLPDSARAVLTRMEAEIPSADPTQGLFAAAAYPYILLGEPDRAIDSYKRYLLANPTHGFKPDRQVGWWWRSLRDHPRFSELLVRP